MPAIVTVAAATVAMGGVVDGLFCSCLPANRGGEKIADRTSVCRICVVGQFNFDGHGCGKLVVVFCVCVQRYSSLSG